MDEINSLVSCSFFLPPCMHDLDGIRSLLVLYLSDQLNAFWELPANFLALSA
jgi:hypothetical protein